MIIKRAAKVLICRRDDGKYLLLTASLWPENPRRSQKPDFPGGVIESHEMVEEGLIREVREEIGLDLPFDALTMGYSQTFVEEDETVHFFLYVAQISGSESIQLSWEHEGYEWLSREELMKLEIRQPYPDILSSIERTGLLG